MNSDGHIEVAIIGGGPRGLSVLERICANERQERRCRALTVHVVDPAAPAPARSGALSSPATC